MCRSMKGIDKIELNKNKRDNGKMDVIYFEMNFYSRRWKRTHVVKAIASN